MLKAYNIDGPTTPLYGSIVIMALIVSGVLLYFAMDYCLQKRKAKDSKKINVTGLTDFELRPIEDQDINYDEAVNMFNSSRSMVTNQRNSSMSMLDKTNFGIGGAKGIP